MNATRKKNILVTGSHRSGSTWTGKMLSLNDGTRYIHEPFHFAPNNPKNPTKYWFEYISSETDADRQEVFQNYINDIVGNSAADKNGMDNGRYLLKDPLALFSADWLSRNFDLNVVVLIRHPAAFAASLKDGLWYHDFTHFKCQSLLMEQLPCTLQSNIHDLIKPQRNIIEHAIVLWNIIHFWILKYRKQFQDQWFFVRHEDLSINPLEEFKKLYGWLGLDFKENTRNSIIETSSGQENSRIYRDSKSNIYKWKDLLTDQEIKKVREGTKEYALHYYNMEYW